MTENPPIIISGNYRSGTSLLWRLLSADLAYSEFYYEPLHPFLPSLINTSLIYRCYRLNPKLLQLWSPGFHSSRFYLCKSDQWNELYNYLRGIVCNGTISKFTRIALRLSWILEQFPTAFIINLVRDPRDVCLSYLRSAYINSMRSYNKFHPIKVSFKIREIFQKDYFPKDLITSPGVDLNIYFAQEYLNRSSDFAHWAEYINELAEYPPYIRILGLWRVNVEQSLRDIELNSDRRVLTIFYEDICHRPEKTFEKIYRFLNRDLPNEIRDEFYRDNPKFKLPGRRTFHEKIVSLKTGRWKAIEGEIWHRGIEAAGMSSVMKKLSYL